jgi:hypothetical protein
MKEVEFSIDLKLFLRILYIRNVYEYQWFPYEFLVHRKMTCQVRILCSLQPCTLFYVHTYFYLIEVVMGISKITTAHLENKFEQFK